MLDTSTTKICTYCNKEKHIFAFGYNKTQIESRCKVCRSAIQREYYKNNKEQCNNYARKWAKENIEARKIHSKNYRIKNTEAKERDRNNHYLRQFGITIIEYTELFNLQNGVCAICHNPETAMERRTNTIRNLSVDHNHLTGKVRGLLCSNCNRGLGYFKDNQEILLNASYYLDKHNGQ